MPSFGKFETTREIPSSQGAEVYIARRAEDKSPQDYVVKVFTIELQVGDDAQTKSDLDPLLLELSRSFADRIQIQKKAAQESPHVAPVLDSGRNYRGPWFVTPYYPRTLQKVIQGKVSLGSEGFLHIVQCITEGAIAFQKTSGRSHGNIKLANVFISSAGKIEKAEVALSDPLPGDAGEAARYELADLKEIGRIIFQLVRRREISDGDDWLILPIQTSKEWTDTFGKNTRAWLNLCNKLLDNSLSLETYSLKQLSADLNSLAPKPILPKSVIIGAVAVLLAAAGVFAWIYVRPSPTPTATLNITSDPPGAVISMGVTNLGKTPLQLQLPTNATDYVLVGSWQQEKITNTVKIDKPGQIPVPFNFPYGTIQISSDPPGASVTLDDKSIGVTGAKPLEVIVPLGAELTCQLTQQKLTGYKPASTNLMLRNNHETVAVMMTMAKNPPGRGTVDFESNFKRGVRTSITSSTGAIINTTENQVELDPGHYTAHSRYTDSRTHKTWPEVTSEFDVTGGTTSPVTNAFPSGALEIDTVPDGVSIWEGTNQLGETPFSARFWPPGEVTFTLLKDGFDKTNATVTVRNGESVTNISRLTTPSGMLEVITDPPGAEIFSGGKSMGTTMRTATVGEEPALALPPFLPGPVTLSARYAGLDEIATNLTVQKGATKRVYLTFPYAEVSLEIDPPSATVNDQPVSRFITKPGALAAFRIAAPDYVTVTTNVTMGDAGQKLKVPIRLSHGLVKVKIELDPPVDATLSDELRQTVKLDSGSFAMLPWGAHKLVASYPLLDAITNDVSIPKNPTEPVRLQFKYGTLSLTSSPPNADILFGGSRIASTPLNIHLKPEQYSFDISLGGQVKTVTVNIKQGARTESGVAFTDNPPFGIPMVFLKPDFWAGKFDVTQKLYKEVMGTNPSAHVGDDLPVESVTWDDANNFCKRLNAVNKSSKMPFHASLEFRLPTKAEWIEMAGPEFATPNTKIAVYKTTGSAPVGSLGFAANGLADIRGNVLQLLWDRQSDDSGGIKASSAGSSYLSPYLSKGDPCINSGDAKHGFPNVGFRVILAPSVDK